MIDIFYYYRQTRSSESNMNGFEQLDSKILHNTYINNGKKEVLPGMFDLRLPLDKFKEPGIYNVYIKPREIKNNPLLLILLIVVSIKDLIKYIKK